jgi:(E)-4-hydroxy-3-methylbut-2-enyl-diphosphate synthase
MRKAVKVRDVVIGGGAPIVVQSMTKTYTKDVNATIAQIKELEEVECQIVRIGVEDAEDARAISRIKREVSIPIVADVHFHSFLALLSMEAGADKVRINPANMRKEGVKDVAKEAKRRAIPLRVGVNEGSAKRKDAHSLAQLALDWVKFLEDLDFTDIVISVKSFHIKKMIEANRIIARSTNYPIHIGITEAGPPSTGIIRSCCGIAPLLLEGIGDTLRISLTADPKEEVICAYKLLSALELRKEYPQLISCPTCSRCKVPLKELAEEVEEALSSLRKDVKVAVMGCVVNGPGEAASADVGVAFSKGRGFLFKDGKILKDVRIDEVKRELLHLIEQI